MKQTQFKTSLAISAIFFIMPGALIVNPAIQTIADAYPNIPYTTILLASTIPLLMTAPFSLIAGSIAGNKIGYKKLLFIALTLYMAGGSMPFIFRDFTVVLVGRTIYGIGVGLATPLANGLVIHLFEGQKRANMMGLGSIIINASSTFFMLFSGFISTIDVNYIWLIHLTALIPLILIVMYLPEPKREEHHKSAKAKLPISVYIISLSTILVYTNLNPMLLNMSTILTTENIGNAAVAGTVLSMYTFGGIIGGFMFGKVYKLLGRMTISTTIVIISAGLGIIYFSHSVPMMIVGATVAGIGFFNMFPAVLMEVGHRAPVSASAMAAAFILSAINLGGFLSSFYIGLISAVSGSEAPRLPIQTGAVVVLVIAAAWLVFEMKEKYRTE